MGTTYPQASHLAVALDGSVLRITLDNPKRRNALDDEAVAAFAAALDMAQSDENVRCVLLSGKGEHFCSGFDIVGRNAEAGGRPRVGSIQRRLPSQAHRLIPLLYELQAPVVTAVSGFAVGIGMQVALVSDFVIAGASATFWEPFSERGMTPDAGATWLLPRLLGPARARRLLLLGERLSAADAVEWGLAYACVDDADLHATAEKLAARLANGPTVALGLTKWLLNSGLDRTFAEHLSNEAFSMELSSRSPDFREGLKAFVEKRDPNFTGR